MTKITLSKYPDHEMAFVFIDDKVVFSGNYHDFHSGCHGTKIGGVELKGKWDTGMDSLVTALKAELKKKGSVAVAKITLKDDDYNKLMGYKAV